MKTVKAWIKLGKMSTVNTISHTNTCQKITSVTFLQIIRDPYQSLPSNFPCKGKGKAIPVQA
jgi:hypothetical protein